MADVKVVYVDGSNTERSENPLAAGWYVRLSSGGIYPERHASESAARGTASELRRIAAKAEADEEQRIADEAARSNDGEPREIK